MRHVTAPHWDHDIHGAMLLVHRDGTTSLDDDCDCPLDCPECKAEGVDRPDLMDELVRISQGPHPNGPD